MRWAPIVVSLLTTMGGETAIMGMLPEKYQPVAHLGVAFAIGLANLFVDPPHKEKEKAEDAIPGTDRKPPATNS